MPKRPPKTGYFYFLLEFRDREAQVGHHFSGGPAEMTVAAAEEWRNLSAEQKNEYNLYAKQNQLRKAARRTKVEKMNNLGISCVAIEAEVRRKGSEEQNIIQFVENFISTKNVGQYLRTSVFLDMIGMDDRIPCLQKV